MKTIQKEWSIPAPWGKIALASWGNTNGERVLLVHGRQDSLATFIPLLEYLPEQFYYVGVDMPGNGRSEPFPKGVKLSRFHFVAAVELVLKHLEWDKFVYIGHSMGCEQGLFFNVVFPGRISKFVLLDFGPSLQRLQVHDLEEYYSSFYREFYENYDRDHNQVKLYSREEAINAVCRARSLSRGEADIVLSRNLHHVEGDKYRLSWDRRLKYPAPQNYPVEYYHQLFSLHAPPTLLIAATDQTSNPYKKGKESADKILKLLESDNFRIVTVNGGHDVHLTNPDRCEKYIVEFITAKSKL